MAKKMTVSSAIALTPERPRIDAGLERRPGRIEAEDAILAVFLGLCRLSVKDSHHQSLYFTADFVDTPFEHLSGVDVHVVLH